MEGNHALNRVKGQSTVCLVTFEHNYLVQLMMKFAYLIPADNWTSPAVGYGMSGYYRCHKCRILV